MAKKSGYDYFESFIAYADCALNAAQHLRETVLHFDPATLAVRMDELHAMEHAADGINHQMLDHLAKEFLPPIEREDLALLSQELDDVVDAIDDIMRKMCMYNVKSLRPEVLPFCELLVRCCTATKALTREFARFKKSSTIKDCLVHVNALETEGDTLHFDAVKKLFSGTEPPLDVFVWKDIFDGFEACYDDCEHVAEVIESVVLKNS